MSITSYHYSYMGNLTEGVPPPPIIDLGLAMYCGAVDRVDHWGNYELIAVLEMHEAIACVGHKFGTLDKDFEGIWDKLRLFYKYGTLPDVCLMDYKERAKFMRCTNHFFFAEDKLWLWLPAKLQIPPCLVIEDVKQRQALLVQVHDERGH
ncbi:hypothetical protein CVT25_012027 [Psilocybe cyanescens]|uniref:Uncharacterized protein n=1 Tax=Psilocybe cyanescens TaxID=93625 RepID=A0A409XH40_PSICY|nr:hypothetical protein CVT25_012027 [Psilocybe cyanescens]